MNAQFGDGATHRDDGWAGVLVAGGNGPVEVDEDTRVGGL